MVLSVLCSWFEVEGLLFGVWCLVFGVWCLVFGVRCLVCRVVASSIVTPGIVFNVEC